MAKRKTWTTLEKLTIVLYYRQHGYKETQKRFGVCQANVHRWNKRYSEMGEDGLLYRGVRKETPPNKVKELRAEIKGPKGGFKSLKEVKKPQPLFDLPPREERPVSKQRRYPTERDIKLDLQLRDLSREVATLRRLVAEKAEAEAKRKKWWQVF